MTSDLILHHYDFSNYSEKARLALGYKGLDWHSVIIPPVAPKPDLTPLTGGYRRTPVLQIGADIYCDTQLILRELERRKPQPMLFPAESRALADAIAYWAEHELFRPISLYVSGSNLDVLPPNLQADRSLMRGLPVPDEATVKRAAMRNAPLVRILIARVEEFFRDGRRWIAGDDVTVADFACYHALWFVTGRTDRLAHELAPYPRIGEWMQRMRGFSRPPVATLTAREALDIAAAATPAAAARVATICGGSEARRACQRFALTIMAAIRWRANWCLSMPRRSRCAGMTTGSARSSCIFRGWAMICGWCEVVVPANAGTQMP